MKRFLPAVALLVVVAGALFAGAGGGSGARRTESQRVAQIASDIRCPTCAGLSAAESEAATSKAIRAEIARQVRAGRSDGQIRRYFVDRYGPDILLRPRAEGIGLLVWALPVTAFVVATGGLALAFRRWRDMRPDAPPTEEDRVLVERARAASR